MQAEKLYARVRALLIEECRAFADSSPDGRLLRLPGVTAAIVPAAPERSAFNWAIHERNDALVAHYPALAQAYADAGVRAWTVWLDPGDEASAGFLAARGHVRDSQPVAMAAAMEELVLPAARDLDWVETRDLGLIARINDRAYGFPPPAFEAVLKRWPPGPWRGYVARLEGQPVSALLVHDTAGGDCGVSAVATLPEARSRGIATRLLAAALREAGARGAATTSLQASPRGSGVYAALGYRALGTMSMWERRAPKPAGQRPAEAAGQ